MEHDREGYLKVPNAYSCLPQILHQCNEHNDHVNNNREGDYYNYVNPTNSKQDTISCHTRRSRAGRRRSRHFCDLLRNSDSYCSNFDNGK